MPILTTYSSCTKTRPSTRSYRCTIYPVYAIGPLTSPLANSQPTVDSGEHVRPLSRAYKCDRTKHCAMNEEPSRRLSLACLGDRKVVRHAWRSLFSCRGLLYIRRVGVGLYIDSIIGVGVSFSGDRQLKETMPLLRIMSQQQEYHQAHRSPQKSHHRQTQ